MTSSLLLGIARTISHTRPPPAHCTHYYWQNRASISRLPTAIPKSQKTSHSYERPSTRATHNINSSPAITGRDSDGSHPVVGALLSSNARWAQAVDRDDPQFFRGSVYGQFPKILWIGCADSRVPESVITYAKPGDIFVYRNVANQFHPSDDSALSVLTFALDVLRVEHVLVVGHTGCGGIAACLDMARSFKSTTPEQALDRWLAPLTTLARSLLASSATSARSETCTTMNDEEIAERLTEANVRAQVANVCAAEPLVRAWTTKTNPVWVHGLVYNVGNGRMKDLKISRTSP